MHNNNNNYNYQSLLEESEQHRIHSLLRDFLTGQGIESPRVFDLLFRIARHIPYNRIEATLDRILLQGIINGAYIRTSLENEYNVFIGKCKSELSALGKGLKIIGELREIGRVFQKDARECKSLGKGGGRWILKDARYIEYEGGNIALAEEIETELRDKLQQGMPYIKHFGWKKVLPENFAREAAPLPLQPVYADDFCPT